MAEENHVIEFLKTHNNQASLDQVSEGLAIPKYGSNSAYALLQSLRSKVIVRKSTSRVKLFFTYS